MGWSITGVEIIFFLTLVITFTAAYLGRKHSKARESGLAGEGLNKWLIGLSAGATANSGFIVTGAVGLGYSFGPQWLFLPLSWFLGDLVFWRFFPNKINRVGKQSRATTLSELIKSGVTGKSAKIASVFATVLIIVCLGGYTSAQWIAGQKFVSGAFELSSSTSLILFACIVVAYTSIGGFRGSVYADAVQAVIRFFATLLALFSIIWLVLSDQASFLTNINNAGASFSQLLPGNTLSSVLFFILGYAFASFGFGLGQPQLVSRYLAGSSPEETKAAQWIYIGFIQFTWISMTLFGVLLRGVMPDIEDPEAGLSLFFNAYFGSVITGIIVADVFATIAATSNSLLVAMAQAVTHDILPDSLSSKKRSQLTLVVVFILGFMTMIGAIYLAKENTVFAIALGSVSLMGAGLAAPVLIKVLAWKRTGVSLLASILGGFISAVIWKQTGMDKQLNEAAIGILVGLIVNWIFVNSNFKINRAL
jgi:sodium/proline symporter